MTYTSHGTIEHEVFPNAPLQLVAAEVTYPATDMGFDARLFAALESVLGPDAAIQLTGQIRPVGPISPEGAARTEAILFRMTSADRTVSVSAWPTSLIVECSEYERFEKFRDLLRSVIETYVEFMAPEAVSRFGMRYIDEMHVPTKVASVDDWRPYVNPSLLAPASLIGESVTSLATAFTVDLGQHKSLNVRCATTAGRALWSEGHLVLRGRPNTPAFVLDIDAVFEPPKPQPTPVSGDLVAQVAAELRNGVRQVFDIVFTDDARETWRTMPEASA